MPDYWSGLVEGFQGHRERNYEKRFKEEQLSRAQADRVFEHLLSSRDPKIQELAISGLMNPIHRKKGFAGFMGEVEKDPYAAQIVAAMNEMVPDDGGMRSSAPIPPRPGSVPGGGAGMSTNTPVSPGSEPIQLPGIQLPPEPPPGVTDGTAGMASGAGEQPSGEIPMPPEAGGAGGGAPMQAGPGGGPMGAPQMGPGGIPMPPGPPVESKWKRRGTGVPTAEEIAEESERRKITARTGLAVEAMQAGWFDEETARRVMLDAMGVPSTGRNFTAPSFAVMLPGQTNPVPVSFDTSTGKFFLADGRTPVPLGAKYVRMSGAAGG